MHQSSLFHFSLFSVLSEQELHSKRATVAELSRRLQWSRQRFFWPEKIEPIFTRLFLEHHTKLARKAIETVVKSGHDSDAGNGDTRAEENSISTTLNSKLPQAG